MFCSKYINICVFLHYHSRVIWQLLALRGAFSAIPKDINGNNVFCGTVTGRVNSSRGSSIAWSQQVCHDVPRFIPGQV
jgi:hypothetical protein